MKQKLAKYISTVGHPMVTFSAYVIIVMFTNEEFKTALFISFLIIGCLIVPNAIRNQIKTQKGEYTNFDVSDRIQRNSMYLFALPLMLIVTFIVIYTGQSSYLCFGVLFALFLLLISFAVNFHIKCSGHVSSTIYLSCLIMPINMAIGTAVLLFSGLMGWSRVKLKRHTVGEVYAGAAVGLVAGFLLLLAEGMF